MRKAKITRETKETRISLALVVEGKGKSRINTGIHFLDHMLANFAKHGKFDLTLNAKGDLELGQHHTVEDIGIALGLAFEKALGDKKGINRAGFFAFPMDEALALVALDISGRPYLNFDVKFRSAKIGDLETDEIESFFQGFANNLRCSLHVRMPYGKNEHHKCEALFKAFGKALSMASSRDRRIKCVPSTKGIL